MKKIFTSNFLVFSSFVNNPNRKISIKRFQANDSGDNLESFHLPKQSTSFFFNGKKHISFFLP